MEEYENLQFENQQLHVYTDDLETKLRNIRLFLQQGITLHTNLVKLKNTRETRKFLEFLQDAISIVQETQLNHQLPVAKEVESAAAIEVIERFTEITTKQKTVATTSERIDG